MNIQGKLCLTAAQYDICRAFSLATTGLHFRETNIKNMQYDKEKKRLRPLFCKL